MNQNYPIFTEKTKCRDCYKCVRVCPVKAIKVEDNSARIIHELCVYCGRCVYICPAEAKKVRNDVVAVKEALASGKEVILSIAPTWSSGIFGTKNEMIGKFKSLGFAGVSETALGAQVLSQNIAEDLSMTDCLSVSTACPSIVELFKKYYPDQVQSLTPYLSPLGVHATMLKKQYGEDALIVFAGPCISKKLEADSADNPVDFALTFDEISRWFDVEGLSEERASIEFADSFIPCSASHSTLYALEGGMIGSVQACSPKKKTPMIPLSGMSHVIEALEGIDHRENMFLELLSCPGGCVNGSGFNSRTNQFSYRKNSFDYFDKTVSTDELHQTERILIPQADEIQTVYHEDNSLFLPDVSETQIQSALAELGKTSDEDLLDCGGCGYNSCREFAVAYLHKMGEKQMCVTNMRKRAQKKIDMLLRTLPMGVVIINRHMKIAECNGEFLKLFSEVDFQPDEKSIDKLVDLPISSFIDITTYLETILSGEKNLFQELIKHKGNYLRVSFFSIEKESLAGVIFQDITSTTTKREVVIKKAEEVINKNLQNVQQIASLLGENAAETEIILRSLTDVFQFSSSEVD